MGLQKPNILLVVTDQEQAHPPLPSGYALPNHERLERMGVTFDQFQVTTTLCTPSRACMYTGQHTPHNGMFDNLNLSYIDSLSTEIPTLGTMLRQQGYDTAYKGKWHLARLSYSQSKAEELESYGFSDFQMDGDTHGMASEGAWRDARFVEDAISWFSEPQRKETPWLLALNLINPHDIMFYHAGDGHEPGRMSVATDSDLPVYQNRWDVQLPVSFEDNHANQPSGVRGYVEAIEALYGILDPTQAGPWERHINYYLNCLLDVDFQLGVLLDGLIKSGQLENTIIIYTSDHGEMAASHRLLQKGPAFFKELVNVPLIVVHPSGAAGERTSAVGSSIDLIPTCLEWAGLPQHEIQSQYPQLAGQSFANIVSDPKNGLHRGTPERRAEGTLFTYDNLFTYDQPWFNEVAPNILAIDGTGEQLGPIETFVRDIDEVFKQLGTPDTTKRHMIRGIFDGRYKLIRYFSIDQYQLPESVDELLENNDVGLYDLVEDPHEMYNLANSRQRYETLLDEMNQKLNRLIRKEIGDDAGPYGLTQG